MVEDIYERYTFTPGDIDTYQPASQQIRTQEAKELALKMLVDIHLWGVPPHCHGCGSDSELPGLVLVTAPKDPQLQPTGACLCSRCLAREDAGAIITAAFREIEPDAGLATIQ